MQIPTVETGESLLHALLHSPAALVFALAAFVRWVGAPSVATYTRSNLAPELEELRLLSQAAPVTERRLADVEQYTARLDEMMQPVPATLARIEERLDALHARRVVHS